jgi:hypothetical protein
MPGHCGCLGSAPTAAASQLFGVDADTNISWSGGATTAALVHRTMGAESMLATGTPALRAGGLIAHLSPLLLLPTVPG